MRREFLRLWPGDVSGLCQRVERRNRRFDTQARIAPAANQLPQLRAEFQLSNAAACELDIVRIVLLGAQLRMQLAHARDRIKIEITAEHKWHG